MQHFKRAREAPEEETGNGLIVPSTIEGLLDRRRLYGPAVGDAEAQSVAKNFKMRKLAPSKKGHTQPYYNTTDKYRGDVTSALVALAETV